MTWLVVGEGPHDRAVVFALLEREGMREEQLAFVPARTVARPYRARRRTDAPPPEPTGERGPARTLERAIRHARVEGHDGLVLVLDRDGPGIRKGKKGSVAAAIQRAFDTIADPGDGPSPGRTPPVAAALAVETIDAWVLLLAGHRGAEKLSKTAAKAERDAQFPHRDAMADAVSSHHGAVPDGSSLATFLRRLRAARS